MILLYFLFSKTTIRSSYIGERLPTNNERNITNLNNKCIQTTQ